MKVVVRRGAPVFPAFIPPCLAAAAHAAPTGPDWVHEIKFDGYRLQAQIAHGQVRLLTRTGLDWTNRFSGIARSLAHLQVNVAVLDGEAIWEDAHGVSSFAGLVAALKALRGEDISFVAFDLLHVDGTDTRTQPLAERKAMLRKLLRAPRVNRSVRYSEHFEVDGGALLAEAAKLGVEGIVSKRIDRPYHSGRTHEWLKIKCSATDEFVVIGYLDLTRKRSAVGALVVGYYHKGTLTYAGRVGTGFSHAVATELWDELQPLRVERPPVAQSLTVQQRKGVRWLKPRLVVQVDYRGWTADRLLRHASFQGVREDKPASAVHRPRGGG